MKIHSLILDHVRGIDHLELTDLPDTGVLVIYGDNEAGKSTILEALNLVLDVKHSADTSQVRSIQSVGQDEPIRVAAHLTVGDVELRITKQWLRKQKCELTILRPTRESYTKREAEDKLAEILDAHLDPKLRSTLFLAQDQHTDAVAAEGIRPLERVLATESGSQRAENREDDDLFSLVTEEYHTYFQKSGKPKKQMTAAHQEAMRAADRLAAAQQRVQDLQAKVTSYGKEEDRLKDSQARLPERRREYVEAEDAWRTVAALESDRDRRAEATGSARAREEAAQAACQHREELIAEVATHAAAVTSANAEVATARTVADKYDAQLTEHRSRWEAAQQALEAAAKEVTARRARLTRLEAQATYLRSRSTLDKVTKLNAELAGVTERLREISVRPEDLHRAERAETEVTTARRVMEHVSAHIVISAEQPRDLTLNGMTVTASSEAMRKELTEPLTVVIEGVTVCFEPPAAPEMASPVEQLKAAEADRDRLLTELGCDTVDEVRGLVEEYRKLVARRDSLSSQRATILGAQSEEELRGDVERAREHSVDTDDRQEALEDPQTMKEDLSTARDAVAQSEEAEEQARKDERLAADVVKAYESTNPQQALVQAEARAESARGEHERMAAKLAAAEAEVSSESLESALAAAVAEREEKESEQAAADAALAAAEPELARQRLVAAKDALSSMEERIHDAQVTLAGLRASIDAAAGADEECAQARDAEVTARRAWERMRRQSEAAALLYRTMAAKRLAVRERYAKPYVDAVTTLARVVFGPGVTFNIDDQLAITGRALGEEATIALEQLSGGAQEQMALISRFAIAELAARDGNEGRGVPVIVDDSLGNTDPIRLRAMGQLFSRVGRTTQVIVLTCMPERFDFVSPKTQRSMNELTR